MYYTKTKKPWHFTKPFLHEIVQDIALFWMIASKTGSGVYNTPVTFTVFTVAAFNGLFFVSLSVIVEKVADVPFSMQIAGSFTQLFCVFTAAAIPLFVHGDHG